MNKVYIVIHHTPSSVEKVFANREDAIGYVKDSRKWIDKDTGLILGHYSIVDKDVE